VRPHTAAVTSETLGGITVPAYSPELATSDFHLFSSIQEALGGKGLRVDDEVKLSDGGATTDFLKGA
jgi:hypothetical protein